MKKLFAIFAVILVLSSCALRAYWNYGRESTVVTKLYHPLSGQRYEIALVQAFSGKQKLLCYFKVEKGYWDNANVGDKIMPDTLKPLGRSSVFYYNGTYDVPDKQ